MAVVSALAAKVDNLTATVSGLSTEFAAFKNQQHTVCSGTSTVAPTPSLASGAQQGQGESAVCQHSLCDPPKKKDNAAGQCATAAAPTPRMDTPAKPVKGATQQPLSPSGMAPAPPASESKSPVADCKKDNAGEWTLVSRKKKLCFSLIPARTASPEPDQGHLKTASLELDQGHLKTASPEPDQGHLMAAMQMLMEQVSCLTQEVEGLKTQMQHHRDERSLLSDHFALETTLPVQSTLAVPRKHLTVPPSRMMDLVIHVVAW
ncbi:predicted GPI-anchored protein 58 [Portunus trituberculatus]|uniref:predicted GPI-anchored protein 58 n=1 Tax=Portunus trituberculatus TaxID=210409 RepID=UPI001E1CD4FE|nr:predicted GPI-anchored protein 58 [Portunus trituberculatus]